MLSSFFCFYYVVFFFFFFYCLYFFFFFYFFFSSRRRHTRFSRDWSSDVCSSDLDLNIALSKTFLNDKLTVSVGENFGIEGQDAAARDNASFIPDVTIAYKLTDRKSVV